MSFAFQISVLLLLTALEPLYRACADPTERLVNVGVGALRYASQWLLLPLAGVVVAFASRRFGLPSLHAARWPLLWDVVVFTLVMDFGEYAFHRAQHAIPFLWRMHALHHSDGNVTATTAERHWWGDSLLKALTVWPVAAAVVGPDPRAFFIYNLIMCYHYFVHSNLRVNLGSMSWLINAPAYHRRHHSMDPEHYGSNFAALFPIFDLLTGAYRPASDYARTGGADRRPDVWGVLWPRSAGH